MSRKSSIYDFCISNSAPELGLRYARSGHTTCVIEIYPGSAQFEDFVVPDELLNKLNIFPAFSPLRTGSSIRNIVLNAIELARLAVCCGKYDLVILDRVQNAISEGYVMEEEIRSLGFNRAHARIITTGMFAGRRRSETVSAIRKQQRKINRK